jgi:hypothetical protein
VTGENCKKPDFIEKVINRMKVVVFIEVNDNRVGGLTRLTTKMKKIEFFLANRIKKKIHIDLIEYDDMTKGHFIFPDQRIRSVYFQRHNE